MSSETYPYQTTYLQSYQAEIEPAALIFAALGRHRRAPRPDGLRYLELGCGHGMSLAAHAACHPNMHFHGIDIMAEHIAGLRGLAADLDLDNLTGEVGDIAALAEIDPPGGAYDIIALHGVWSWVGEATRRAILRLLPRWAAPGALIYISYNARPFWNVIEPLRYVLREAMGPAPNKDRMTAARDAVEGWLELAGDASQKEFWSRVKVMPDTYLIHEFGSLEAASFWPQDVARGLASGQISPVGQLPLIANYPQLRMADDAEELIALGEEMGFAQTAADLAHARSFRSDLYAKGAPRLPDAGLMRAFDGWQLLPTAPPEPGETRKTLPGLAEALDALPTPIPLTEAVDQLGTPGRNGLQGVMLSVMLEHLVPVPPGRQAAEAGMRRFNDHARVMAREGTPLPCAICLRQGCAVRLVRGEALHVFAGAEVDEPVAHRLAGFDFSGSSDESAKRAE